MSLTELSSIKNYQPQHTLRVRPRIHPRIRSLLQNKSLFFDLIDKYGSPLNLIFPQNIHDNIADFQKAYKKHRLRGRVYFTSKPCKSHALMREACKSDIGIDVSSAKSLETAIHCGWTTDRIGATGPKSKDCLSSALQHNVLINVDNIDELKQIVAFHQKMGLPHKARITIRIADYNKSHTHFTAQDDTTFGIRLADMNWIFEFLKTNHDQAVFHGISFHSSMASDEQRIAAMETLLQLIFQSRQYGLSPTQINIGGGFPIMYADSCQEWEDYTITLKQSVAGQIPCQTWNNIGLGYRIENGAIRGGPAFINHAPVYTKGEELDRWLSFRLPTMGNTCFADIVRDSLLHLCVEPGRGMLDQCGITLGRVTFTKLSSRGENLVGLEMNHSNLHSDHFKRLTEPCILSPHNGNSNSSQQGVYYMGNLCLANDMLQHNKTYPEILPQQDDIVAFMNTAAYMMDFTESETLMQPVAQKIALTQHDTLWHLTPDQDYRS